MDHAKTIPALSETEDALRAAQTQNLGYAAWPDVLKRAFSREERDQQGRELRFLHIVGVSAAFGSLVIDLVAIPQNAMLGLALRVLLLGPISLVAVAWGHRLTIAQNKMLVVAAPTTFACIVIALSGLAEPAAATRYLMGTLMLFAALMLTLPFRPRELLWTAITYSLATLLTAALTYRGLNTGVAEHSILTLLIGGATFMIARRSFDLRANSFLAGLSLKTAHAQLEHNNAVLRELSEIDALTGLANRRAFRKAFKALTEKATDADQLTILMLDIDHFKQFNDEHGHPAGDRALRLVARSLEPSFEQVGGLIARFGGEEFVGAIHCQTIAQAEEFAEMLRREIRTLQIPVRSENSQSVTASIGIASAATGSRIDMGHLIARADRALYRAKKDGRDRVIVSERIELRVDRLVE